MSMGMGAGTVVVASAIDWVVAEAAVVSTDDVTEALAACAVVAG